MVHYFRTTPDGRIAFGWGGGRVVLGARTHGRAERDPGVIGEVERHMRPLLPRARGRRIEQAWGGPIDVSPSHLPVISRARARDPLRLRLHGPRCRAVAHARPLARLAGARAPTTRRAGWRSSTRRRSGCRRSRFASSVATLIRRAILRQEAALERGERARPGHPRPSPRIPERIGHPHRALSLRSLVGVGGVRISLVDDSFTGHVERALTVARSVVLGDLLSLRRRGFGGTYSSTRKRPGRGPGRFTRVGSVG